MDQRLKAIFDGMVQGVGFRFTVERISRQFAVKGYVRNLANGKVELVAEGAEGELKNFLNAIREGSMSDYIRDVQVEWSESKSQFKQFEITF
ncbi:MAG: acylphosphatase [Candidatus Omnitrophica bacterium]|nr:acylphosphatase [Candidatus Omnitrophota bacterium]